MGFLTGIKIAKKILSSGSQKQPTQNKPNALSKEHIQQTRICSNCGGFLFGNRMKRSQLICSRCGHHEILY